MTKPCNLRCGALLALTLTAAFAHAAEHRDERIFKAVQAERAPALDLLRDIVNIDSGTGDVEGGTRVEALLIERLTALGADVQHRATETPGLPDNIVATFKGGGRSKILLIAHVDTVFGPGTASARPFRTDGQRAYGPGVGDEKAGVINAITALKILHDVKFRAYGTLTLLLDNSEERGSPGSTQLIKALSRQHDVVFNMEPGDPPDAVTVWRKGSASVHIRVIGRSAHAGMAPQNGRNAATELVHQLTSIESLFPHSGEGVTVNLTVLRAGERNNIIPDAAEATLNVRYRRVEEFDQIVAKIEAAARETVVPDTGVTITHDPAFPPLTENPQIDRLARRAEGVYAEIGHQLTVGGNGGASESALAMSEGTPALDGLGFVGGDFHTDKEWIDLESVAPRLYLLTRLLMETAQHPR